MIVGWRENLDAFLEMLGWGGAEILPREAGLNRKTVRRRSDIYGYVASCVAAGKAGYLSLFSLPQIEKGCWNLLFVDIDPEEKASQAGEILVEGYRLAELIRRVGGRYAVVYSGGGGFHVYHHLQSILPEDSRILEGLTDRRIFKRLAREYVEYVFRGEAIYEGIDWHCVGDVRRMVKIPGTNGDIRRSSIILIREEDVSEDWLGRVEKVLEESPSELRREGGTEQMSGEYPPCIALMVERLVETGELDHLARFQLVAVLSRLGWSGGEIAELFKAAEDYDERTTRYQVEHILSRGYEPYGCRRIEEAGFCPYRCRLYPRGVRSSDRAEQ